MDVAWIRTVGETEATGHVKTYYDAFVQQRGWVPNIVKAFSIRPDALQAFATPGWRIRSGPTIIKCPSTRERGRCWISP
jgi:hypothetical protein